MTYVYILFSEKSHRFYFGSAKDLPARMRLHNQGAVGSTKYGIPWKLVWYAAFSTEKEARNFEAYLKSGSGKSFAYRHFISVVLAKDFQGGRKGSPKTRHSETK